MSYKAEVIADSSGWKPNRLRFATEEEALSYVNNLAMRWVYVRDVRVVETNDPVNSRYVNGELLQEAS